jgi:hypothetical protein
VRFDQRDPAFCTKTPWFGWDPPTTHLNVTAAWDDAPPVLKNSTEGENSDLRDSIGFRKIQKKSAKFGKIWPKRTGDDGGIVEIRNTKIRLVLVIYRPTSLINR